MIRIDGEVLDRIAAERRFETQTLQIARRIFLHKETPKRVASEFGVIVQRVYAIRRHVLAAAEAYQLPTGWSTAELVGPRDLVDHYKRLFDAALARRAGEAAAA